MRAFLIFAAALIFATAPSQADDKIANVSCVKPLKSDFQRHHCARVYVSSKVVVAIPYEWHEPGNKTRQ